MLYPSILAPCNSPIPQAESPLLRSGLGITRPGFWLWVGLLGVLAWGLGAAPSLAQETLSFVLEPDDTPHRDSHFGQLLLKPLSLGNATEANLTAIATATPWTTGGSSSLTAIANFDDHDEVCTGYSYNNAVPDHLLYLSQDFDRLSIQVNSGGEDTTLVVVGPQGIHCGDDRSATNADGWVYREHWEKGTYQVWVGTGDPGQSYPYRLEVQQEP